MRTLLPVLGVLALAFAGGPTAQAHERSGKHHGSKSGKWHKKHGHKHGERRGVKHNSVNTVSLAGGRTKLSVAPGTAAALGSLGIKVKPIGPAYSRDGAFKFPITGGEVDAQSLAGQIRHSGGLAFVKGSTRVALTDFFINVDGDPDLTALVGGARVSILALDLSGLQRWDRGNKIVLSGIQAILTAGAAAALNSAFKTGAFQAGLPIGTAQVKTYVHHGGSKSRHDDDGDDRDGDDRDDDDDDDRDDDDDDDDDRDDDDD